MMKDTSISFKEGYAQGLMAAAKLAEVEAKDFILMKKGQILRDIARKLKALAVAKQKEVLDSILIKDS